MPDTPGSAVRAAEVLFGGLFFEEVEGNFSKEGLLRNDLSFAFLVQLPLFPAFSCHSLWTLTFPLQLLSTPEAEVLVPATPGGL